MKIVHICLCDPYDENWAYHRNILSEQNKRDGHETYIVTGPYVMNRKGLNGDKKIGHELNKYGIHVYRLENKWELLPKAIQGKVSTVAGLYEFLEQISPDIIMVHNLQTFNLREIIEYRRQNDVLLLGDTHASFENSCRNPFSRYVVHGLAFRKIIKKYFSGFDSFYFIGDKEHQFFSEVYGIETADYQILPLPARFIGIEKRQEIRTELCRELNIDSGVPLFVHSGKLVKEKKTKELLTALHSIRTEFSLLIIGNIPADNNELLNMVESDQRFKYLGWKSSAELSGYLLAADLYLQPGTPSVTLQNALAVGTPALISDSSSYSRYYGGWEHVITSTDEIRQSLQDVLNKPHEVEGQRKYAYETAREYFDCKVFATEMYNLCDNKKYKEIVKQRKGCTVVSKSIVQACFDNSSILRGGEASGEKNRK